MLGLLGLLAALQLADAARALEQERYADAVPLLEKALAADPADYRTRFNLAFALAQLNRDPEAIEQYTKVVEQQPDLAPARLNLGILLLRQKQPAAAGPHLEIAAEKKPQDFRARFYLAEAMLATGRLDRAQVEYRKALELDPRSAAAELGLGRALARAGRLEAAQEHYRRAADLDAGYRDALLELGELLEQQQPPAQALDLYLQFLAQQPDAVAVRERAGVLLLTQQRYSEAVQHLERAVEQHPTAANRAALAQGYVMLKQPAKAAPLLRSAAEAEPDNADLRFRLAAVLLETGDWPGAAREFLAVAQKQRGNREAWNGLAFALYRLEDYNGALQALDRARQLGPEPPGNHFLRAVIFDKFHQYPEALQSYEQFLKEAAGRYPDDEFKARQRVRIITNLLNKRR